jgi:hypothetical protein
VFNPGITVFPNPVKYRFTISFTAMESGNYHVTLFNPAGATVFTKVVAHSGGNGSEWIDPGQRLPRGVYQLQLKSDHHRLVKKVVIE